MGKKTVGFFAVQRGHHPGVYETWDECEREVKHFSGAKYKKLPTFEEAEAYARGDMFPVMPASSSSTSTISPTNGSSSSIPQNSVIPPSPTQPSNGSSSMAGTISIQSVTGSSARPQTPNLDDESLWDVVYCDGASRGNGQKGATAGVGVYWGQNDPRNISERCPGDQTNNRAELIAVIRMLEETPYSRKPLLIKTDSQYTINCFTKWLPGWERNGWRTSAGEPVKNKNVIKYLAALLDLRQKHQQKTRLKYVKGHSGDVGNDGADRQANLGAAKAERLERDWLADLQDLQERAVRVPAPGTATPVRTPPTIPVVLSVSEDQVDFADYKDCLLSEAELQAMIVNGELD